MRALQTLLPCSLLSPVAAWTSTLFFQPSPTYYSFSNSSGTAINQVVPTGPVTATRTSTTVATYYYSPATLLVTVTSLFVAPNASVCKYQQTTTPCTPSPALFGGDTTAARAPGVNTTYFAPLTVRNPASCANVTSFEYTTARNVSVTDGLATNLAAQATEPSEAAFVTTYVSTRSIDLGGQAVVRTVCHVYLRDGAAKGLQDQAFAEQYYLQRCIDPRRFLLCSGSVAATGGCPTADAASGSYPPTAPSPTSSAAATGRGMMHVGAIALLLVVRLAWSFLG